MEKKRFYGYEVVGENLDNMGAFLEEAELDAALEKERINNGSEIEEYSIGVVLADTVDAALDCIRRGDWEEVTQKL